MIKCKRIIDGKTYNTETATELFGTDWSHDEAGVGGGEYLFQTRFGAYFLYKYYDGFGEDDFETISPCSPDEARQWLEKKASYDPDLIERLFVAMPEAGSGEIRFTLRLPESLRDRLAALAKANHQSLNAWMVKCLESCASANVKKV